MSDHPAKQTTAEDRAARAETWSLWADYIAWALAALGVATAIRIVDMLI